MTIGILKLDKKPNFFSKKNPFQFLETDFFILFIIYEW